MKTAVVFRGLQGVPAEATKLYAICLYSREKSVQ